jgi:hypothetical protein
MSCTWNDALSFRPDSSGMKLARVLEFRPAAPTQNYHKTAAQKLLAENTPVSQDVDVTPTQSDFSSSVNTFVVVCQQQLKHPTVF